MKIVTVGDNCMDVYEQTGKAYPGGNPVNVAVYLRRLNHAVDYVVNNIYSYLDSDLPSYQSLASACDEAEMAVTYSS